MKLLLRFVLVVVVLVAAVVGVAYFTGNVPVLIGFVGRPWHGWDMAYKAPTPDYADAKNWAALPSKPGFTAYVPKGEPSAVTQSDVDVFFPGNKKTKFFVEIDGFIMAVNIQFKIGSIVRSYLG